MEKIVPNGFELGGDFKHIMRVIGSFAIQLAREKGMV